MKVGMIPDKTPFETAEAVRDLFGRSTRLVSTDEEKREVVLQSLTIPFCKEDAASVRRNLKVAAEMLGKPEVPAAEANDEPHVHPWVD